MPLKPKNPRKWLFTDAVAKAVCPRCGAKQRQDCRQPMGKVKWPPHTERIQKLTLRNVRFA